MRPLLSGLLTTTFAMSAWCAPSEPIAGWSLPTQIQQTWDDGNLVEGYFLSGSLTVHERGKPSVSLRSPSGASGMSLWKGRGTALHVVNGKILLATKEERSAWIDKDTSLNQTSDPQGLLGLPISLLEADTPERFLAANFLLGFRHGNAASPLSTWRVSQRGTLEPGELIPLELDGPVFLATPSQALGPCMALAPRCKGLVPFLEFPIRVPDAFVVVSLGGGVLWTIKEKEAKVHRTIRLFPLEGDAPVGDGPHARRIHAIQPMPDGRLLAALRPPKPAKPAPGALEAVRWKVVDPLTGIVADADATTLSGAPTNVPAGKSLTFRFDAKGRVRADIQG